MANIEVIMFYDSDGKTHIFHSRDNEVLHSLIARIAAREREELKTFTYNPESWGSIRAASGKASHDMGYIAALLVVGLLSIEEADAWHSEAMALSEKTYYDMEKLIKERP